MVDHIPPVSDPPSQAAQAKQGAMQAAVKELETVCGKDFQPTINAQGDLECAAKEKAK